MAKYIIHQFNDHDDFHNKWSVRYIIYKKRWYGRSWKMHTNDIDKLAKMVDNLKKKGHIVLKHWSLTADIEI